MDRKKSYFLVILILCSFLSYKSEAQIKGEPAPDYNSDSNYVFNSPRPLIDESILPGGLRNVWGIDLTFTNNGFGLGPFYERMISEDINIFGHFYISGARKTDEFEVWDPYYQDYRVPNKINRIFMIPMMFGLEKFVLQDELSETFRPFISAGVGPTFVITTPYDREFFSSFGKASFYVRPGGFLGIGAYVPSKNNSLIGIHMRYYYIPFGGNGIESVIGQPITDMGGLYLSLSLASRF